MFQGVVPFCLIRCPVNCDFPRFWQHATTRYMQKRNKAHHRRRYLNFLYLIGGYCSRSGSCSCFLLLLLLFHPPLTQTRARMMSEEFPGKWFRFIIRGVCLTKAGNDNYSCCSYSYSYYCYSQYYLLLLSFSLSLLRKRILYMYIYIYIYTYIIYIYTQRRHRYKRFQQTSLRPRRSPELLAASAKQRAVPN